MSNHSSMPNDELRKASEKMFSGQNSSKNNLAEILNLEAKANEFGETKNFPEGKLTEHDEGEIQFGVTTKDEKVILNFGKPVAWMGMTRDQAEELGRLLIDRAKGIQE